MTVVLVACGVAAPWVVLGAPWVVLVAPSAGFGAITGASVSRDQAERALVRFGEPEKVRAYYTTLAESARMLTRGKPPSAFIVTPGKPPISVGPDPDTRVWLVVARMPAGHGPKPSLAAGSPEPDWDQPTNFVTEIDATTGRSYSVGAIGGDWPRGLPPDNVEDLIRDLTRRIRPR